MQPPTSDFSSLIPPGPEQTESSAGLRSHLGATYTATRQQSIARGMTSILSSEESGHDKGHSSFVAIYDELRPRLYNNLIFLGMTPDKADDVIQETFLTLFRHLKVGAKINDVRGWTFRVAHNLSMSAHKQGRRTGGSANAEAHLQHLASPAPDPEQEMLSQERVQRLVTAVDALTGQQRECLLLRREGLRYREIAVALGISPSRVPQLLERAINRLVEELYG